MGEALNKDSYTNTKFNNELKINGHNQDIITNNACK